MRDASWDRRAKTHIKFIRIATFKVNCYFRIGKEDNLRLETRNFQFDAENYFFMSVQCVSTDTPRAISHSQLLSNRLWFFSNLSRSPIYPPPFRQSAGDRKTFAFPSLTPSRALSLKSAIVVLLPLLMIGHRFSALASIQNNTKRYRVKPVKMINVQSESPNWTTFSGFVFHLPAPTQLAFYLPFHIGHRTNAFPHTALRRRKLRTVWYKLRLRAERRYIQ